MCDNRYLASSYASKDKKADILQAYVEQYYRMAMDHYTKAGTMSQILLGFVTAMLVIIGYDNHINGSLLDIMGATMVFIIGGVEAYGQQDKWKDTATGSLLRLHIRKN
jgi:hypothetical protein